MTTDSFIQVPPAGAGKKVDNSQVSIASDADPQNPNTVQRQRVSFADPVEPRGLLRLLQRRASKVDWALPVRVADDSAPLTQQSALRVMVGYLERLVTIANRRIDWRDRYLQRVQALEEGEFLFLNGNMCLIKRTFANIAASQTDSSIVTAVGGKKIRVLSYRVMAGGTATDFTFNTKPTGAGSAISEKYACG